MSQAVLVETVAGNVIATQAHDRMTAWACVNAIMAFTGQDKVPFGEWHDAVGEAFRIDPVEAAKRIMKWRKT